VNIYDRGNKYEKGGNKMSLSNIFEGKVMGFKPSESFLGDISMKSDVGNLMSGALDVERKATQQLPKLQFDILGFKRTKKQKGLKPLGDWDNDNVMNIFDCEPYNKKKQGFIDKTMNLVKGHGFVENQNRGRYPTTSGADAAFVKGFVSPSSYVLPQDIEKVKSGASAVGRGVVSGAKMLGRGIVGGAKAVSTGVGNVYKASGAPEYLQKRDANKEWEEKINKVARAEALKYAQKLKVDKMIKGQTQNLLVSGGQQTKKSDIYSQLQQGRSTSQGVSQGVSPFVQGASDDRFSRLLGFGTGSGEDAAYRTTALIGNVGGGDWSTKVQETVGSKGAQLSPMPQGEMMSQSGPPQISQLPSEGGFPAPQQAPQQAQYGERSRPPEPGMVWSERSKKWVRYPRGAYKKYSRPQTYNPPQNQAQPQQVLASQTY